MAALFELVTQRLTLREICVDDAQFMLELLNEPSFLHFIGDKGVRTIEESRQKCETDIYIFQCVPLHKPGHADRVP